MQKRQLVEDPDYPDYTSGVSIDAVTIDTLPVDISARTIESLTIDAIGEIIEKVDIHVKTVESGVTFYVDAAAGATFDVNIKDATGVTFNVDIVDATGVTFNVNITDAVTINVNAAAGAVFDVKAAAGAQFDVTFDVANLTGKIPITFNVADLTGNIPISFDVDNLTGNIPISFDVANLTGDVRISIESPLTADGNVKVDIAAQTVDINIKTSGETNIVIDQLTQEAYRERRSTLANNGATPSWYPYSSAHWRGKYFPRGCRGFLHRIHVYSRDAGTSGGTITVYVSPHPTMGPVASATITVPAGGVEGWRSTDFKRMWNYDSLFVWLVSSTTETQFAWDTDEKYDGYFSNDGGATWEQEDYRRWIRVDLKGETVGDLPVSGTLNTIEIPAVSTGGAAEDDSIGIGATVSLITVNGAGKTSSIACRFTHSNVELLIFVDGAQINDHAFTGYGSLRPNFLNDMGCTASTPGISLTLYNAAGACAFLMTTPIKFRRKLELKVKNWHGANIGAYVGTVYELMK